MTSTNIKIHYVIKNQPQGGGVCHVSQDLILQALRSIIQRGNNKTACFYSLDDYHKYLTILAEVSTANNCHIHSYVLMTNHMHILLAPNQPNAIAYLIQDLGFRQKVCSLY